MTTLIIADNNPDALEALVAGLRQKKPDWEIFDVTSAFQVLQRMAENDVDCVISDVNLEDMSGLELLSNVQAQNSDLIRFLLAPDKTDGAALDNAQTHHRLIHRTASDEGLINAIATALRIQKSLNTDALKLYMSQTHTLPSLPHVYQQLVAELASPQSSLMHVASVIETDVGLTATVLKIVNSAFYGLNQQVESVSQGVALLGAHLIKNITLTAKVFAQFEGGQLELKKLQILNDQANKTGALANHLARLARLPKTVVDHTQVAGMLANVGQLLAMSRPNTNNNDLQDEILGAYLLKTWLMPDPIVEAVAMQNESPCAANPLITPYLILYVIRYLEVELPDVSNVEKWRETTQYLETFVPSELTSKWLEAYRDLQLLTAHNDIDNSRAA